MKKILLFFAALAVFTSSFAFSGFSSLPKKADDVYIPIGTTGLRISLKDLSTIDVKDFEKLSGRHLNFFDKLGFKLAQKKLRNSIKPDGTIDNKRLNKLLELGDHSTGFHLGGFALGFLLSIIGVLLAYVIGGEEEVKRNRVKWAWIGFGLFVVIYLVLILA
jgi:hypothetical protein